jgi:transposase
MLYRRDICSRQKWGSCVGKTKRGKGTKIMAVADRHGLPLAVSVESAQKAEVALVEDVMGYRFTDDVPVRLIADKGYDSDPLDEYLRKADVELIAPHRSNRKRKKTQDGRALRRYRRRWKMERLFSWLYNFRRIVTRWEYHAQNFLAFVQLACVIILLRHYL